MLLLVCLAVFVAGLQATSPPARCEPVKCRMFCKYGWMKDSNGCDKCECRPAPPAYCSEAMCMMYCHNGFVKDDNGCDVCRCRDKPCNEKQCRMNCPRGFKKDENGCATCRCREEPRAKTGRCPPNPFQPDACAMVINPDDCWADNDCSGDRKCCPFVCRKKCMAPAS